MFLYVVGNKVATHFNNDGKGLKVYRQETQKLKWITFSEVKSTAFPDSGPLYYIRRLPAQKLIFQKNQALLVIKRFYRSLIHILTYFQSLGIKYLEDMNI